MDRDEMQPQDDSRFAFVLMPFDPEFDRIYAQLIKPALEDEGFEVQRADDTFDQQNILRTIVQNISTADLIVAELTSSNPNVFYELGIAHALSRRVVLLCQELEQVPFDLRSYNIVTYTTHFGEVEKLKDRLSGIARRVREGTINFGSPVSDFAPSNLEEHSIADIRPMPEELPNEMEEDSGPLDFIVAVEDSLEQIGATVEQFAEIMENFGQRTAELASKAEGIDASGVPGRTARVRELARNMASEIKGLGEDIQAKLPSFYNAWERMEDNFTKLLSITEIKNDKEREQAAMLMSHLDELKASISPGREGLEEARDELRGNTGLSGSLNVAIRGTAKALDDLIEELSTGESSITRMRNLLEQKMELSA